MLDRARAVVLAVALGLAAAGLDQMARRNLAALLGL